ncbi:hypothetical protein D915_004555 [Fasciola hepatica]|uniref:Dynein light chain n=1 Tax=Fasciola hepatica TaxID=6192 RepID=A0A4E0REK5_FASHE|nr:hypothetical protein D915_004555 [Fasciola hepatica]
MMHDLDGAVGILRTGKNESIDTDMPLDMQNFILSLCTDATRAFKVEREIALHIKQKMQERYSGHWNCIVGMRFGSALSHEAQRFLHVYFDRFAIIVFQAG